MPRQRKTLLALVAWVLPLVMLASWSAQAAGMFCRSAGTVVRSACCCGAAAASSVANELEISDAGCCEVTPAQAPLVVPIALPLLEHVPPALPVLFARLPEPVVVPPAGRPAIARQPHGKPLPLLKHAFLV